MYRHLVEEAAKAKGDARVLAASDGLTLAIPCREETENLIKGEQKRVREACALTIKERVRATEDDVSGKKRERDEFHRRQTVAEQKPPQKPPTEMTTTTHDDDDDDDKSRLKRRRYIIIIIIITIVSR